jgi:hypothetical protein
MTLSLFLFPWCKKKLINIIKVFRYKIFLRFWLQTFFEFFIVAGYGIKYNKFENAGQIVDFCLCLLIYVKTIQGFQIFGFCILINAIRIRYKLKTTEEIESFYEKFGTFFEEFKDQGIRLKLFYIIYILRRLFLGLSIFFSPDPAFQTCVAISFSISVFYMQIPIYVLITRDFKSITANFFHFFNELLIGSYYCYIFVSVLLSGKDMTEKQAYMCQYFVMGAWGLNAVLTIINTVFGTCKKIRDWLRKRRTEKLSKIYQFKTHPDTKTHEKTSTIGMF